MEATGKLHRLAHRTLSVNPLRSRLFAEAIGTLAKTDLVDARMLAVLGESLHPAVTEPPSELLESASSIVSCARSTPRSPIWRSKLNA